jgi:hypothetical protein
MELRTGDDPGKLFGDSNRVGRIGGPAEDERGLGDARKLFTMGQIRATGSPQ